MNIWLASELDSAKSALQQKVKSFVQQVNDLVQIDVLNKQDAFPVLKRTLNVSSPKIREAKLKHDTFLDYYLSESHLECHRRHLRLDDHYMKVLTLKEPSAQSFPLIFKALLEIQANFHIVTEWKKEDSGKTTFGPCIYSIRITPTTLSCSRFIRGKRRIDI